MILVGHTISKLCKIMYQERTCRANWKILDTACNCLQKEQQKSVSKRVSISQTQVAVRIVVLLTMIQKAKIWKDLRNNYLHFSHTESLGNTDTSRF